jgi:hypothetical protein
VQISPDGIHWVDEGAELTLRAGQELSFARIREFGGLLRLAGTVQEGRSVRVHRLSESQVIVAVGDLSHPHLYSFPMSLKSIDLTHKHQQLLDRLAELIPDLDPDKAESLQRIFGLGLIALTMQVTSKAREEEKDELVEELGALAREMVESEA